MFFAAPQREGKGFRHSDAQGVLPGPDRFLDHVDSNFMAYGMRRMSTQFFLLTDSARTLSHLCRLFSPTSQPRTKELQPIMIDSSICDPSSLVFQKASTTGRVRWNFPHPHAKRVLSAQNGEECKQYSSSLRRSCASLLSRGISTAGADKFHSLFLQRAAGVPLHHGGRSAPVVGLTSAVS